MSVQWIYASAPSRDEARRLGRIVVALPISQGHPPFLEWIRSETRVVG